MKLRTVFMGSADLACASLEALLGASFIHVTAVVTQPDKPKGRELKLTPSEVKNLAQRHSVPVIQPLKARDPAFLDQIKQLQPELVVVTAYGQILSQAFLDIPRYGCLNVHTSILPRHRGAAPIQWALLEGDRETGVTLMKMDAGLDTGAILAVSRTAILLADNSQTLHDRLAQMGAELLIQTIPRWVAGELTPEPQPPEGSTYARKISKEDGLICWSEKASTIFNKLRAFTPWPGIYTRLEQGGQTKIIKIWAAKVLAEGGRPGSILGATPEGMKVGCGEGALLVTELQKEGGRRMTSRDFLAGTKLVAGKLLG